MLLVCKMILEQPELNINAITSRSTALHIAAANGNKKLAQILLFHDADLTYMSSLFAVSYLFHLGLKTETVVSLMKWQLTNKLQICS